MNYRILLFFISISFFWSCKNEVPTKGKKTDEQIEDPSSERISLEFDSLFVRFPVRDKFQYFELASFESKLIEDNEKHILYRIARDRSCVLEYDRRTATNRLYSKYRYRKNNSILLDANHAEFNMVTEPISMKDGFLYFDSVKGIEVYKPKGEQFEQTSNYKFKNQYPDYFTVNLSTKSIECYYPDPKMDKTTIRNFSYVDDQKGKKVTLDYKPLHIRHEEESGLYISIKKDESLIHTTSPSSLSLDELNRYSLPHRINEIKTYSKDSDYNAIKRAIFEYEIEQEVDKGIKRLPANNVKAAAIYIHQEGVNTFQIIDGEMKQKSFELKAGETKSSFLLASEDYLGMMSFISNTPGVYSNDTKLSKPRLILYSISEDKTYEILLPAEVGLEYRMFVLNDMLYVFSDEFYYVCNLGL